MKVDFDRKKLPHTSVKSIFIVNSDARIELSILNSKTN